MAPAGASKKNTILRTMAKRPEIFCFALAVIVTYLAKYTKSSNERTIYQAQAGPKHFFSPTSAVLDFPYGNLEDVGVLLEDEEVLFVMFYAPWCGDSIKTRPEFEKAATFLRREIQFVAINCWYVSGECRGKNTFMSFPVLYFYQAGLNGYKYSGLHTAEYISVFVQTLLSPVSSLTSDQQLVVFLSQNDNSMVGFFDFHSSPQPPGYLQYYYAAMRAYERDHKNPMQFGVIGDPKLAQAFGMMSPPSIYYCRTLNDTLKYSSSNNLTATAITNWAFKHRQKPWVQWLLPSGVKSLGVSTELQRGPAVLAFIPDHPLASTNQYFQMLREVAMTYHNCKGDKKWNDMVATSQFSRWDKLTTYLTQLEMCNSIQPKVTPEAPTLSSLKHTVLPPKKCCLSVSLGNLSEPQQPCVACINYPADSASASHGCNILSLNDILPLWGVGSSLLSHVPVFFHKYFQMDYCTEWKPTYNPMEHVTFCCHNNTEDHKAYSYQRIEPRYSTEELHNFKNTDPYIRGAFENNDYEICEKLQLQRNHKWLPSMEVSSLGFDNLELFANISGNGCQNKSLNFYAMSSKEGQPIAASLGIDREVVGNTTHQGTVTLIVDLQNEIHHKMKENFTKQNIGFFIKNYTSDLLHRYLRSHETFDPLLSSKRCDSMGTGACITTVTSHTFQQVVMDTDKDVVLLYHTPWCGFCASFSHIYLSLARYFRSAKKLLFARINADENDLPWEYTVEAYPTILLFPAHSKEASIVFPENLQKTLPNLVVFLLRFTTHSFKLETSLNICSKSCLDSNMAASSQRVTFLNNEIITLQGRISKMEHHIRELINELPGDKSGDPRTGESHQNNWWVSLLRRYTSLLKWRRNRKFLQKKNLRLLFSILKNSEGLSVEKRKLLRILKQYESYQKQLSQMIQSKHLDLDKNFVTDLREVNKALDAQVVQGQQLNDEL